MPRKATKNIIAAAAATEPIIAAWDAKLTIIAETPAAPNPAAKLDNPDSQGGKGEPGQNGGKQVRASDGKPPVPRFTMTAYNGGPMSLNGYRYPVIVDGTGIKAAAANLPIYCGHCQSYESPQTQMELLMGQTDAFSVDQATGEITASGPLTGESATVKAAQAHARNGFKFQASINARPSKIDFVPDGVTANVNGRPINGPCVIARAVTCDHIAIVPLGADTSTTASIAAEAAKGIVMEFAAWLIATYALDAATLTAAQKTKFEAEFNRISAAPKDPEAKPATIPATGTDDTAALITARRKAFADEDARIGAVQTAAKGFPEISAKAITEGWTVDRTELEVLRAERKASSEGDNRAPAGQISAANPIPKDGLGLSAMPAGRGGRHTAAGGRISDELSAVIECAGLISAGYSADRLVKHPCYGQRAVEVADKTMSRFGHGLGPAGLMRLAASFAGVNLPQSPADPRFLEVISAEFTTLSLPVILSNLMNKFLLDSYIAVDPDFGADAGGTAWQKFTKRGPLNDFKPHYRVRLAGDVRFQALSQTGEIQHGRIGEQSYKLEADTKAILLGITRKDIINDDLSVMSTVPTLFGRGAGVTIAQAIYAAIIAGYQSDGSTSFFTSSAVTTDKAKMTPNLITGSALSFTTLEAAEAAFAVQTDPFGLPAGVIPEVLLCPPALKSLAMQLWQSKDLIPSLSTGGNARGVPMANTLAGKYKPVVSAYLSSLTSGSATTWYLVGGPQQPCYFVEAGFLNGQEMPIVERAEANFNTLGIMFRGFQDFGVNLAEPRAVVKATA